MLVVVVVDRAQADILYSVPSSSSSPSPPSATSLSSTVTRALKTLSAAVIAAERALAKSPYFRDFKSADFFSNQSITL